MADPRESLVNSIIGAGSAVDGDIDVDGLLRIDGDVRGTVRVTGKIVVGAAGRVEAPIRAKSAIIGGLVKGDVYVSERLRILSGGMVIGNVFAPRFEAEDGTVVHGDVAVTGRLEGADEDLAAFVRGHGDGGRFLGPFRARSFAPSRERPAQSSSAAKKPAPDKARSASDKPAQPEARAASAALAAEARSPEPSQAAAQAPAPAPVAAAPAGEAVPAVSASANGGTGRT